MSARLRKESPLALGGAELAATVIVAFLFAAWTLAWDRAGLLHAGPIAYTNHEACDAWYYFGLSILPKVGLLTVPGTRTLSRVMYFGVVHELKILLPWLGVSVLSYFAFLPLTLATLYIALRSTFSRVTSALAVLMLGTTPLMLNMMSTTYVTVAAMAYGCASLACLMWAARLSTASAAVSNALFAAGGLLFAWAANANVIAIEFFLPFTALALLGRPAGLATTAWYALETGGLFVLGFAGGVATTMVFAQLLGLGPLSPFNQIRAAIAGVGEWWHYEGWQIESVGLILVPLAAVLFVVAFRRARRSNPARGFDLLLIAGVALATCTYDLVATLMGDQGLVYDYFYFLVLPCIALVFCAAFDDSIRETGPRRAATLFAVAAGYVLAFNAAMALSDGVKGLFFARPYVVPCAALVVLGAILAFGNRKLPATTMSAVLAITVLLQTAAGKSLMGMYYHPREPMQRRTEMAEAALGFIFSRLDDEPVVWLANGDDFRLPLPIVRGLQRCRYAGAFPDALPEAAANTQPAMAPGRTVIVMDGRARPANEIEAALRPYGYKLDVEATRHFTLDSTQGIQITIGKVRSL